MMEFKQTWSALNRKSSVCGTSDATTQSLMALLSLCPDEASLFSPESYARLASTIVEEPVPENDQSAFFSALNERRWSDLLNFQNWNALSDNTEAYAIRSIDGQILLMLIHSPHELYEEDRLLAYEYLDSMSVRALSSLIREDQWKPFDAQAKMQLMQD